MSVLRKIFRVKSYDKRRIIMFSALAALFGVAALFVFPREPLAPLVWGAAAFFLMMFPLEFSDEMPPAVQAVALIIFSGAVFIMMQKTISCGVSDLSPALFAINVLIVCGLASLIRLVSGSIKASLVATTVLVCVLAVADHFVVQARSYEIQFSDISSIGTAAGVAAGYKFSLLTDTREGIMLAVCIIIFVCTTHFPRRSFCARQMLITAIPVCTAFSAGVIIFSQIFSGALGITDKYWKLHGSQYNGFWVNIINSASATRIVEPQDYYYADLEIQPLITTLTELPDNPDVEPDSTVATAGEDAQNIIVIMNETFSDVHNVAAYLGYEMNTSVPILPFFDSLTDQAPNVIKGHALASVYGGNTANSEFEFLTGMSMAFLPRGTVPYNFYLNSSNTFSAVDCFNSAGYRTVGMHPDNKSNWRRSTVYDYLGFDEKYFINDFEGLTEEDRFRGHVSDAAVYDKIISLCEEDSTQPLFCFAVTMQNHGGYNTSGFESTVELTDYDNMRINEYLSSINSSDAALRDFLEYLEGRDEDYTVVFFGDHQPSLPEIGKLFMGIDGSSDTEALQAQYIVPYLFWSNHAELDTSVPALTSLNFLASYLLDMSGVGKTEFLSYTQSLNSQVMALNAFGWLDYDFNFTPVTYGDSSQGALTLYSSLQYNALFDKSNRIVSFFSASQNTD